MLLIGKINGLFGIKGQVKIFSYTSPIDNICQYKQLYLKKQNQQQSELIELINIKKQNKTIIAQIKNIDNYQQAESLLKSKLYIKKTQLPKTQENEYYYHDLIGKKVVNHQQKILGIVDYLFDNGANGVMVVKDKNKEYLIPFIKQYITTITTSEIQVYWQNDF